MLLRHLRAPLLLLLGAHVLVHGLACDDGSTEENKAGAGPGVNVDDLRYEGGVTDEAAQSILGVTASVDDGKTPLPSAPTENEILPSSSPFTFSWSPSSAHRPRLPPWLGPERSALAHGTPYTGVAYILTFRTDANPRVLRVATSKTSYTPDEAAWNDLKAASSPLTLTLTVARTESNLVVVGGGPYTSSKGISFSIAP